MGQTVSTTQWYVYGKKHFTKTGYLKHVKAYSGPFQTSSSILRGAEGADGVDMEGKVVVITGANSGIGKELATYAAAKGASVYMLCRSKGRAETARDEISKLTASEKVRVVLVDTGEMAQVRKAAEELQSMEKKVDCLVCNAGALLNERAETSEGNEITFASHLLGGSFLLPQLLMPQLKEAGSESRVVFVSSGGMYLSNFPDWSVATNARDCKKKYDGQLAYEYAKRGQVLLAEEWTKKYPDSPTWVSCHPGWTGTPGVDAALEGVKKYLEPMRDSWQGAEGIAWLMSTESKNLQGGAFYLDRKPQKKHIAGAFMSEGSFTKNTPEEVDTMMENLKKASGL